MEAAAKTFSPGSITAFFEPRIGSSPRQSYSRGVAICVDLGVSAAVEHEPRHEVVFNGRPIDLPPVAGVVRALAPEPVTIWLESPLPIGCGLGVSAASALSTAFALNRKFELKRSRQELGDLAHAVEVECGTGLGDVAAQLCGGVVWRHGTAGPLDAAQLPVTAYESLFFRVFEPLPTREVLTNPSRLAEVASAGARALNWLAACPTPIDLSDILDRSLDFAKEAGLLTDSRVVAAIAQVKGVGGSASMAMLGQTVVAASFTDLGAEWTRVEIDPIGTR